MLLGLRLRGRCCISDTRHELRYVPHLRLPARSRMARYQFGGALATMVATWNAHASCARRYSTRQCKAVRYPLHRCDIGNALAAAAWARKTRSHIREPDWSTAVPLRSRRRSYVTRRWSCRPPPTGHARCTSPWAARSTGVAGRDPSLGEEPPGAYTLTSRTPRGPLATALYPCFRRLSGVRSHGRDTAGTTSDSLRSWSCFPFCSLLAQWPHAGHVGQRGTCSA